MVEPACSLCELVVSKPLVGVRDFVPGLATGCQGFRLGSLVPRDPAQPASGGSARLNQLREGVPGSTGLGGVGVQVRVLCR